MKHFSWINSPVLYKLLAFSVCFAFGHFTSLLLERIPLSGFTFHT